MPLVDRARERWTLGIIDPRGRAAPQRTNMVLTDLKEAEWHVFKLRWAAPWQERNRRSHDPHHPWRGSHLIGRVMGYGAWWSVEPGDTIRFTLGCLGGAVWSTGSIAFAGSLGWNNFGNNVCRIASNVPTRFADPEPFDLPA